MGRREIVLVAILLASVVGNVIQASQRTERVLVYLLETDARGRILHVGTLPEYHRPTTPMIRHFVTEFVHNTRSISLDPVVVRRNWEAAGHHVTRRGKKLLDQFAIEYDVRGKMATTLVGINVTSVVARSKDTYQIRWRETVHARSGEKLGTHDYTGMVTFVVRLPQTEEEALSNPRGLYVESFAWAEDFSQERKKR